MPCHGIHDVPSVHGAIRAESELSPAYNTKGKEVNFSPLKITDMPAAMRNMGWHRAAQVMQKWQDGEAHEITGKRIEYYADKPETISADMCDETTVTMDWALGYPRVREAYEDLRQTWCSPAARLQIVRKLKQQRWPSTLGTTSCSARILHGLCQVQYISFGSKWDTIDEMYGLIGEAALYLAAVGHLEKGPAMWVKEERQYMHKGNFFVTDIGIYLRDVYEFNGFQFLGIWTKKRTYGKAEIIGTVGTVAAMSNPRINIAGAAILGITQIAEPFSPVFNHDFRAYRDKTGKGKDMFIFSDVKWEKPNSGPIAIPVLVPTT